MQAVSLGEVKRRKNNMFENCAEEYSVEQHRRDTCGVDAAIDEGDGSLERTLRVNLFDGALDVDIVVEVETRDGEDRIVRYRLADEQKALQDMKDFVLAELEEHMESEEIWDAIYEKGAL